MGLEETPTRRYVLGNDPDELARLDHQSALIARPTRTLLQAAGIGPGMRVLDLGAGLGHVTRIAGDLVGATGAVVGIDESPDALAVARRRVEDAGERHLSFETGDVTSWKAPGPFDAVIGRLILFHVANPVGVVRHHVQNLRPGGVFAAIDYDLGSCRCEPQVALVQEALGWVVESFIAAGASPRIGARLGPILATAGLRDVTTLGLQAYLPPGDPAAARLVTGVVRSLSSAIIARGIATADQIGLPTLDGRIADAIGQADAVLLPPTVAGAWGRAAQ